MMMMNPMLAASRLQNRWNRCAGLQGDTPIARQRTAAKHSLHHITLRAHYENTTHSGKNEYLAEMHMKRKGSNFSLSSIRLAAYTKHEYFICWISQLLCYSAASLGDMNGSGPQMTLCSFEDKTPRYFFFCKVIQALDTPLQSSFSKDADTWQGHWAPGHQYLLTCVHKAPGILVGKAEIEEFCFANLKLVLGLQIIQNYPF